MTELGKRRRDRLSSARLYLVCDAAFGAVRVRAALEGGVDIVQLREKEADDRTVLSAAADFRQAAEEYGALLILNDRPDLVRAAGADGVHVGQDDAAPAQARELAGSDALVGLSTHSDVQVDAAQRADVDYFCVGPVHATPTKPGRRAVGLEPVRHAAAGARLPWFAIGGLNTGNLRPVLTAGARRIVVVRAITEAADPEAAARRLRATLDAATEAGVGAA